MDDNQVIIDNQSVFAAERILKKRKRKDKMQYKVKWLCYPEDQSTWEPGENILDKRLIEHFEHGQKRNQRKSGLQHIWMTIFHLLHCVYVMPAQPNNFNQQINCAFIGHNKPDFSFVTFINFSDNEFSKYWMVELVFLGILRVLVSMPLKLPSKFSSQLFVVPFLKMKVSLALFCFGDLVCLVCT